MNTMKHHSHALPVQTAGAYIEKQAARIRKEAGRVRRGDADGIHDMRVASRRLRVALRAVRPAIGDAGKPLVEQVATITKALGHARELDVMLIMMRSYRQESSGLWQRSAAHAIGELEQVREEAAAGCVEALGVLAGSAFADGLAAVTIALKAHDADYLPPIGAELEKRFRKARTVYRDWRELDRAEDLHRCRIALKKLRYATEFFAPAYDKRMTRYAETIKEAQDLLGDWHDAEVLIDALRRIAVYAPYSEVQGFPLIIESFQHWGGAKAEAFHAWAKEFFAEASRKAFLAYCTEGE